MMLGDIGSQRGGDAVVSFLVHNCATSQLVGEDPRELVAAIDALVEHGDDGGLLAVMAPAIIEQREARYEEFVAATMCSLGPASFEMGTDAADSRHFCGEVPRHRVELSPFEIARTPVTNGLMAACGSEHVSPVDADPDVPVVDVTWLQASLFAISVGCRLATEAEWEYACGAGSEGEWCCDHEAQLPAHAWYSENARGLIRPVGVLRPNALGVRDLHGNVWEWCADAYDADYYARSPRRDPFNRAPAPRGPRGAPADRVCRGGSMHALAEMCRTRYRFHEPAHFRAGDLGFRLARSRTPPTTEDRR